MKLVLSVARWLVTVVWLLLLAPFLVVLAHNAGGGADSPWGYVGLALWVLAAAGAIWLQRSKFGAWVTGGLAVVCVALAVYLLVDEAPAPGSLELLQLPPRPASATDENRALYLQLSRDEKFKKLDAAGITVQLPSPVVDPAKAAAAAAVATAVAAPAPAEGAPAAEVLGGAAPATPPKDESWEAAVARQAGAIRAQWAAAGDLRGWVDAVAALPADFLYDPAPSLDSPIVDFASLNKLLRLELAHAELAAAAGDTALAAARLRAWSELSHRLAGPEPFLINLMIAATVQRQVTAVTTRLRAAHPGPAWAPVAASLAASPVLKERMSGAYHQEYRTFSPVIDQLARGETNAAEAVQLGGLARYILLNGLWVHPNRTRNAFYRIHQEAAAGSIPDEAQFNAPLEARNLVGQMIFRMTLPNYQRISTTLGEADAERAAFLAVP